MQISPMTHAYPALDHVAEQSQDMGIRFLSDPRKTEARL